MQLPAFKLRSLRRNLRPSSPFLAVASFSLLCLAATWARPSTQPVFTLDLRQYGYTAPVAARDVRALSFLHAAVAFLDEHTLAVSYYVNNPHAGFTRRDGKPSGPVLFHSAFVDTRTHSVIAQRSWSNAGYWNSLLPLESGRFLVQGNDRLSVYSRDLRRLSTRRLIYPSDLLPRFDVSPSGRTLYGFQDWQDPSTQAWITKIAAIDPQTLELQKLYTTPMHSDESVSDWQVVYRVNSEQMVLQSYSPEKSEHVLEMPLPRSELGKLLRESGCNSMTFVSNSVLAVAGDCPQLILFTRSGGLFPNPLLEDLRFPGRRVGGDLDPARDGNRLAFALYPAKGRARQELEVDVYDLAERKIIFRSPTLLAPSLKFALALSPEGSQLAVLSDSTVQVWELPKLR